MFSKMLIGILKKPSKRIKRNNNVSSSRTGKRLKFAGKIDMSQRSFESQETRMKAIEEDMEIKCARKLRRRIIQTKFKGYTVPEVIRISKMVQYDKSRIATMIGVLEQKQKLSLEKLKLMSTTAKVNSTATATETTPSDKELNKKTMMTVRKRCTKASQKKKPTESQNRKSDNDQSQVTPEINQSQATDDKDTEKRVSQPSQPIINNAPGESDKEDPTTDPLQHDAINPESPKNIDEVENCLTCDLSGVFDGDETSPVKTVTIRAIEGEFTVTLNNVNLTGDIGRVMKIARIPAGTEDDPITVEDDDDSDIYILGI